MLKKCGGMGFEGQGHRLRSDLSAGSTDRLDDGLMASVYAVEVPDGHNRSLGERLRELFGDDGIQ